MEGLHAAMWGNVTMDKMHAQQINSSGTSLPAQELSFFSKI